MMKAALLILLVFCCSLTSYAQKSILKKANVGVLEKMGDSLLTIQNYEKATEAFTKSLASEKNTGVHFKRAMTYLGLKNYELAILDLTQTIELNNEELKGAYMVRGFCKLSINDSSGCADLIKAKELGHEGDISQLMVMFP